MKTGGEIKKKPAECPSIDDIRASPCSKPVLNAFSDLSSSSVSIHGCANRRLCKKLLRRAAKEESRGNVESGLNGDLLA